MRKSKNRLGRPAKAQAGRGSTRLFPIVGIGASAGGLDAFTKLVKHLPLDTGMGFVLVQHLDPAHQSALTDILGRATSLPIQEVTHKLRVLPNHIYVIPPNAKLIIKQGVLKLSPRPPRGGHYQAIDSFFTSLSEDQLERAIGIILSGTASDGTLGLEAIKAEGGITMAQDESAKYDSMPRSAIAAGCVDFVLSPENIARELARIARHPYATGAAPRIGRAPKQLPCRASRAQVSASGRGRSGRLPSSDDPKSGFKDIFLQLRNHCHVDFSPYRPGTLQRRIHRRMVLSRHHSMNEYAAFLKSSPKETDALYSDLLIGVTCFFRNPDAFEALRNNVFPHILARGDREEPFRAWVLGCSSGQEAYSIAMAYLEASAQTLQAPKLQIFATDLNEAMIQKARQGFYAKNLLADVSPERLQRFFIEEAGGYRVKESLREGIVFARQNLLTDPPFSKMDFVSCRNLMIYLEPDFYKQFLPSFHYALKPEGILFLGASESIGNFTSLFDTLDKKHKIYSRKPGPTPAYRVPPAGICAPAKTPRAASGLGHGAFKILPGELNAQREADRIAVNAFAPPSVLINGDLQILQFRGVTREYLEPPTGKASLDLLKMAREGLKLPLRAAINRAKKENKTITRLNARVGQNGNTRLVHLQVVPLKNLSEPCFLIFFEEAGGQGRIASGGKTAHIPEPAPVPRHGPPVPDLRRSAQLVRELAESRDYSQSLQEHHESASADLQASHEELQSANEELQSLNEELETSKEELESTNEELTTVNEEMANRNTELNRLNNDLNNLHVGVNMAILLLGRDLSIRRFTPLAEKTFNLIAADVGRSLIGLKHNLDLTGLESLVREVIDTASVREREVRDNHGRWFMLRLRPYITLENRVDGAVLVLVDMDALKRSEQQAIGARKVAEASERKVAEQARLLDLSNDAIIVRDIHNRITYWNRGAEELYGWTRQQAVGQDLNALLKTEFEIPFEQLEARLRQENHLTGEVVHIARDGRRINGLCRWALDLDLEGRPTGMLTTITDITVRKQAENASRESEARFRALVTASSDVVYRMNPDWSQMQQLQGAEFIPDVDNAGRITLQEYIHPEDQAHVVAVINGAIQTRSVFELEHRVLRPDGSVGWTFSRAIPLLDADGEIVEWFGAASDITERKSAEAALRESDARFRTMADNIAPLAWMANPDGHFFFFNKRWYDFTGTTPEAHGDGWDKVHHPDHLARVAEKWNAHLKQGEPWEDTFPLRGKDGTYRWFLSRAFPVRDAQGKILRWFGTNMDITELRQTQEALQLAQDTLATHAASLEELVVQRTSSLQETVGELESFSYSLAHDMRAPLRSMRAFSQLLLDEYGGVVDTKAADFLARIARSSNRLDILIQDVLDYTKILRGQVVNVPVDLDLLVRDILDTYPDWQPPRVQIQVAGRLPGVVGNQAFLTQAISNLLSNAVKFVKPGTVPHVQVRAESLAGKVRLSFKDNGIGIARDKHDRIFRMFERLHPAADYEGTGIGLTIARKAVERMGGRIGFDSDVGQGSEFWIELDRG